ncbi:ATP-binding protein [uncultured Actinomyces sp.]|uniref:ATP-binding protein n=1 Tax=uncultured Actinomyces sp. TaxID=249061 RepID=UPI00288BE023|nr:ATP-binding protein [uncultured Actinomyces sp.]
MTTPTTLPPDADTGAGGRAPSPAPGPHTQRMRRLIAAFVAVIAAVTGIFIAITIRVMVNTTGRWAFWLLLPALVLPSVVAGAAAAIGLLTSMRRTDANEDKEMPPERLRRIEAADRVWRAALLVLLGVHTTLVLLAVPLPIIPFYDQGRVAAPVPNILVNYYLVVAVAATAVLSPRGRFLYIVLLAPFLIAGYPAQDGLRLPAEEVMIYLVSSLGNMALLTWLLRQAQALDEADARRRALLIRLRTDASRARARRRADNFIHDHILSVLKVIPTESTEPAQLRAGAREALADLDTAAAEPDAPARVSELLTALTRRLRTIGGDDVVICDSITQDLDLPPEAARALIDAAAEALRNSLAHAAGPDQEGRIARTASLRSDADGITITVSDDGRGFDPERAPISRHGVSGSIIARMRDAQGQARIDSSPGAGTTVTLSWNPRTTTAESPTGPCARTDPGAGRAQAAVPTARAPAVAPPLSLTSSMEARTPRIIVVCIVVLYALVTLLEVRAGSYRRLVPVIAGLLAIGLAALALIKRWPAHRMPAREAALVVAAAGGANVLVLFQIDFAGWPGYAAWCLGAGAAVCCGLIARERPRQAWAGLALIIAVIGIWTLNTGREPIIIITLGAGQLFPLLIWHLTARISIDITARTAASEAAGAEITAQRRAHQESETLMRQAMTSVRRRVEPLLTAIADGAPITAGMRTRARMLEAELRDERRAPFFTGTRVIESARAARTRGIDVILLDDRGTGNGLTDDAQEVIIGQAIRALDDARKGQVVIRLLPPRQRPRLLSIVTDNDILTLNENGASAA